MRIREGVRQDMHLRYDVPASWLCVNKQVRRTWAVANIHGGRMTLKNTLAKMHLWPMRIVVCVPTTFISRPHARRAARSLSEARNVATKTALSSERHIVRV